MLIPQPLLRLVTLTGVCVLSLALIALKHINLGSTNEIHQHHGLLGSRFSLALIALKHINLGSTNEIDQHHGLLGSKLGSTNEIDQHHGLLES